MIRLVLPLLLAVAAAPDAADAVSFVEHRVTVDGEIFDRQFVDVDGDGTLELVVAVATRKGTDRSRRELRIHAFDDAGRLQAEPRRSIVVMDDVTTYGFADLRSEPGLELFFMTPSGVFSYSPTRDGYRDNIARLVETPMFFDVPDGGSMPLWRYVLPSGTPGRGDALLIAEKDGFGLWGGAPDGPYERLSHFADETVAGALFETRERSSMSAGRDRMRFDFDASGGILLEDDEIPTLSLLRTRRSIRSPALVDVDGDGRIDMLDRDQDGLAVHLAQDGAIPAEASRVEPRPEYLDGKIERTLFDLDGDGDMDMVAKVTSGSEGLGPALIRLLVLINDGDRLYPETPDQVLRFEAHEIRFQLSDVDRDGRLDLVVAKYEMPSLLDVATGFELRRNQLIFLGRGETPFERQPSMRNESIFDIESLQAALVGRYLEEDLSGDGLADLVEIDLDGRISVRRLQRDSGWFGGETWSIDDQAWQRFDARGSITNLVVRDVNADGLGDMISHRRDTLLLLLSRRTDR